MKRILVRIGSGALVLGFPFVSAGQTGPRLTDPQLFEALNLDYPGLEQVKADMLTTNLTAAKADLTTYLTARTNVNWFYDWRNPTTAVSYNRSSADQTTNGYVNQVGYAYTFPGGDIDWWYNYTTNIACGCAKNNEWQWTLNRMASWANLGRTYWGTRDENYAVWWSRQLRDWISDCPVATTRANGAPSTWRTIESGIRMNGAWPDAFFRFVLSPSMTNSEHVLYLKSCIEHGRYLTNWYTSENFLTMEMNGLFTIGTLFPELKEAAGCRGFAAQTLYREQTNQFLPDGVHNELTPRYHGVAVGNILNPYDLALTNSRAGEMPAGYLAGMEKTFDFYEWICAPSRVTPAFNDSSRENVRSWLATGLEYFPNRLDYQWLASNGASGAPPAQVSYRFPYAGYGVMRSGWDTNANYLCFDAGALGYSGHRHEDKLNLVLWANGREFLFDNGGGPYDSSIWRTWGQSTYSHNCVIVDSFDQEGGDGSTSLTDPDYVAQAPIDIRWESDVYHDFAAGVYNRGFGGNYNRRLAVQTRRVLFVKPDIFLVADTLVPNYGTNHTYEARWHLRTTNTLYWPNGMVVTTTDPGVPNLAIVPCFGSGLTVANVSSRTSATGPGTTNLAEILGWDLPGTSSTVLPATTVTHTRSGLTAQQFLTLFLPLAAGATNPVLQINNTGATSADIWLNDGRLLQVYADPNPARGLRLAEILPGGVTNRWVGAGFVPPVFGGITNRMMNPNTTKDIAFTLTDADSPASNLVLVARSLDPVVVPDASLTLSGGDSNRQLTITPPAGVSGKATIALTATDPDGSTLTASFALTINSPPQAGPAQGTTWEEQAVDLDLRTLLTDDLTLPANLLFAVSNAVGGTATLLPDGHTVHFVPNTNFSGTATIQVVTTDMGYDPRLLLYYTFEAPDNLAGGLTVDGSDNQRPGALGFAGTGSAALDTNVPATLAAADLCSLKLSASASTNGAQLHRLVPTNEFNFSDHDWTFTGWFRRASVADEDFIFYIGDGDGFGANEELQLHGAAGGNTLSLKHYIGETNTDVNLTVAGINASEWHHAAVTFMRTNPSAGFLRLFVDGAPAGAGMVPRFNLDQTLPIVFGGHNRTNSNPGRWFNGWLDELAVFTVALSDSEVAKLAARTVGHNAGLTATNDVAITVRDINDPPSALAGQRATGRGQAVDVDLRTLAMDVETPPAMLRFSVSGAINGTVTLLADGHTARFTPVANTDAFGGFTFTVTDFGIDPRAVAQYSFEPPDSAGDGLATDNTGNGFTGVLSATGAGTFAYLSNVPPALALFDSVSLLLNESNGTGGAKLSLPLPPSTLDLSDHDWSFSGWFRRSTQTNEDFFFYIGSGDGFGSNEELQLYGYPNSTTVGLRHYIGENTTDVNLSASGFNVGEWHHAAVTFLRTNSHTGQLKLYLDGSLAGTAYPAFNLVQTAPVLFGGHSSAGFGVWRWFNGCLDELVLFNAALSPAEVSRLATGTVGHFGGLSASNFVSVMIGTPNLPPVFPQLPDTNILAGRVLQIAAAATDPDSPPQRVAYRLVSGPAGAVMDPVTGLVTWRPAIAQAGSSYQFTVAASEAGWETNLSPVADAYVRDGSFAGNNFGTETNLAVKLSATAGLTRESFLRFDLAGVLGGISNATLRLVPVTVATPGTQAAALVTNDAWTEVTLTWSNKPASDAPLTTWIAAPGVPVLAPVSSQARAAAAGDRLLSFGLYATNTTSDGLVNYGSREGDPASRPQLSVWSTNSFPMSATQSFQVTVQAPARPKVELVTLTNGAPRLVISGDTGPDYIIQTTTNLGNSAWRSLATNPMPVSPLIFTDGAATNWSQQYYRVLLGP